MAKAILSAMLIYFYVMTGATGNLTGVLMADSTKDAYCEYLYRVYVEGKEVNDTEQTVYESTEKM